MAAYRCTTYRCTLHYKYSTRRNYHEDRGRSEVTFSDLAADLPSVFHATTGSCTTVPFAHPTQKADLPCSIVLSGPSPGPYPHTDHCSGPACSWARKGHWRWGKSLSSSHDMCPCWAGCLGAWVTPSRCDCQRCDRVCLLSLVGTDSTTTEEARCRHCSPGGLSGTRWCWLAAISLGASPAPREHPQGSPKL